MNQKSKRALASLLFSFLLTVSFGCGTGTSTNSDSASGSGSPGSGNLGPNPEPINELPNILPDDFILTSCPDIGITKVFDLELAITSPSAPTYDFDQDGSNESILLQFGNTTPETAVFEFKSRTQTAFPPSIINQNLNRVIVGGFEYDSNFVVQTTIINSFGDALLMGSWTGNYTSPILRQYYVPGTMVAGANQPVFPFGFEENLGFTSIPAPPCLNPNSPLCPGVHVFGGYFADTVSNVQHCVGKPARIIVCDGAGSVGGICP